MGKRIALLEISSYIGAIGAEHYYGKLHVNCERIELRKKLTKEEAADLNRKDRLFKIGAYRAGSRSERFWTTEQVEAEAIDYFRTKLVPKGFELLLAGKPFDPHNPQKILDGTDKRLVEELRAIYERTKGLSWEHNWNAMQNLSNQWERIISE